MRMCHLETPNSSSSNGLRKTSKGPRTNAEKWWPLPSWHSSWRPDRFVLSASMTSSQLDLEVTSAHSYKTHQILNCSWTYNFKSLTKAVFLVDRFGNSVNSSFAVCFNSHKVQNFAIQQQCVKSCENVITDHPFESYFRFDTSLKICEVWEKPFLQSET